MSDDFVMLALIPLVTALVQGGKNLMPETWRDRLTVLLAILCGTVVVLLYCLLYPPSMQATAAVESKTLITGGAFAAYIVLHGAATGLAATGLYHALGDAVPPKP